MLAGRDFMSDVLWHGRRFRPFNVVDDFNREGLTIEVDLNLPAERVVRVLERIAAVLVNFTFTLCERLSEMKLRVGVLAHRRAEERLGRLLLQLAAPPGQQQTEGTNEVPLHIGHEELAKMAAMNRSHVSVTMGKLRRQGLVRYERNRPLVVDVPAFTAYLSKN